MISLHSRFPQLQPFAWATVHLMSQSGVALVVIAPTIQQKRGEGQLEG